MQTAPDHILIGCADLGRGISWVEERTGVRAIYGGVHPGRGSRNALLGLAPEAYLEIIAPDPAQGSLRWFPQISGLTEPKLVTWAARTSDLEALAQASVRAGFPIIGPEDGSRTRADGKVLSWRLFHLQEDYNGLLPFFIQWGRESIHPSTDAPEGCRLENLSLESPKAAEVLRVCQALNLQIRVERGENSLLRARISSPKGGIDLTS